MGFACRWRKHHSIECWLRWSCRKYNRKHVIVWSFPTIPYIRCLVIYLLWFTPRKVILNYQSVIQTCVKVILNYISVTTNSWRWLNGLGRYYEIPGHFLNNGRLRHQDLAGMRKRRGTDSIGRPHECLRSCRKRIQRFVTLLVLRLCYFIFGFLFMTNA